MNRLERSIIVVGTGRCGSTMLHRILARHPQVGWLSTFNEVFPSQPWLSWFSGLYRASWISGRIKHLPFFPKPFEAYRFWERELAGFSRRSRPLEPAEMCDSAVKRTRHVLERVLKFQGKSRLLVKVTGWSRMECFDRLLPDCRFVILRREHRAVISSWIQAGWLDVTSGPDAESWQWGSVPERYRQAWQDLGGGPVLSAALKIQLDLDDIRDNMTRFPDRCHVLDYDDLVTRPEQELRGLVDFCGLSWADSFSRHVGSMRFHATRDKWRKFLSEQDGHRVCDFFSRVEGRADVACAC